MKYVFLLLTFLAGYINAQPYKITGEVSTSAGPVKFASVTFTNNNDASQKFSAVTDTSGIYQLNIITSLNSNENNLPTKFTLEQNYPNPFSSTTSIQYKLKTQSDVHVTIYDILGRAIREFSAGTQTGGLHSIVWNGRNNFGEMVAAGIYFYRVQVNGESLVKKMVFGAGESNLSVPATNIAPSISAGMRKTTNINLPGGNYAVQIDNGPNTYPVIVPQQFINVIIQGDTTLNFTVNNQNQAIVYMDSTEQIIRGFGAANIIPWRPDMTAAEVNTAFGNGPGQLGFTILRLRIPYTDNISDFSVNIPSAKLAKSLGAIVFATPWTPPPALKSNNNIVGGTLKDSSYTAYAAHLKSFADYMASNGVPLYAVSIQNEPDANVTYESCYWNATQFLNFSKNNAQSIGTRIMMPESENFKHALSDSTLYDSSAAANVSIIAGHLYGGGLTSYPLAKSEGKDLWMTEYLDTDTTWSHVLATGKQINDVMNVGMNAYVYWYIVRFYGPINENGNVTKRGYVMSQYSKFVRPGYYKIECDSAPQSNIYVTSYKDSSSSKVVIVVLNTSASPVNQTFSINNGTMTSFTPYTTTAAKNVEKESDVAVTNGSFTVSLEASSITTFVSNK